MLGIDVDNKSALLGMSARVGDDIFSQFIMLKDQIKVMRKFSAALDERSEHFGHLLNNFLKHNMKSVGSGGGNDSQS